MYMLFILSHLSSARKRIAFTTQLTPRNGPTQTSMPPSRAFGLSLWGAWRELQPDMIVETDAFIPFMKRS